MDPKISDYIKKNNVFTLATSIDDIPYCATCFYAFDVSSYSIIFLSDEQTKHISQALINEKVSGTIYSNVITVSKIQGVQFTGDFIRPSKVLEQDYYSTYYKKFPFAKTRPSSVWGIKIKWIKMTDNTLGFGTKISWEL